MVGPTYLRTFDIPVVRGRDFTESDAGDAVPVCIVSEAFVQRHLRGREPIGMRIAVPAMSFTSTRPVVREIVGVARQIRLWSNERDPISQIYVPIAQNPYVMSVGP